MWEEVDSEGYGKTERLEVPSGWLVRWISMGGHSGALTFVPDQEHTWELPDPD